MLQLIALHVIVLVTDKLFRIPALLLQIKDTPFALCALPVMIPCSKVFVPPLNMDTPLTVKFAAVAVPVRAGLANVAYDDNADVFVLLLNSVIISILFTTNESVILNVILFVLVFHSIEARSTHESVRIVPSLSRV